MNRRIAHTFLPPLLALGLVAGPDYADEVTLPNRFSAGTPARASEVNANFDAVKTAVDDNDGRLTAASEALTSAESTIEQLNARVASLEALVTSMTDSLGSLALADPADVEQLAQVIPHLRMVNLELDSSGTETRPTVRFEGVNLQLTSGSGATNGLPNDPLPAIEGIGAGNGLGNLILGYNEGPSNDAADRNGSHNLVVGNRHRYPGYGGVVFGRQNTVSGAFATVTGGFVNTASGLYASVSGGELNRAENQSTGVAGGQNNVASGYAAFAGGGQGARALDFGCSVVGGQSGIADGINAAVFGGRSNSATGTASTVSGGRENAASGSSAAVSGGRSNAASGTNASVSGGANRTATGTDQWTAGSLSESN